MMTKGKILCNIKFIDSKDKNQHLLKLNPEERWNEVFSMASKIKRCGEAIDNGCGYKQPAKIKKENLATLIAEWDTLIIMTLSNGFIVPTCWEILLQHLQVCALKYSSNARLAPHMMI